MNEITKKFIASIRTDREKRIWLAAMFDAEGSINITSRNQLKVQFGMKVNGPLEAFESLFRRGRRVIDKRGYFRCYYYDVDAAELLFEIAEFLIEKKKIAEIVGTFYPCASRKKRTAEEIALVKLLRNFILV